MLHNIPEDLRPQTSVYFYVCIILRNIKKRRQFSSIQIPEKEVFQDTNNEKYVAKTFVVNQLLNSVPLINKIIKLCGCESLRNNIRIYIYIYLM